ncbi:MAG TPA: hypothetical protein VFG11_05585 [Acidobacteriota bacterium]|nr:hypothetical protein [Acidobacteriota bacterium]
MRAGCLMFLIVFAGFVFAEKPPDACTIMTAQDVEKVVGPGFKLSPFHGTASDNSSCGYMKDKNNIVMLTIVVYPGINAGFAQLQKQYAQAGRKVVPIEGGGENAFLCDYPNAATGERVVAIHFGKGASHCVLEVKINGKDDGDAEQKLVKLAYPRLP